MKLTLLLIIIIITLHWTGMQVGSSLLVQVPSDWQRMLFLPTTVKPGSHL